MEPPAKPGRPLHAVGALKPMLLAGGLALMWFVEMQHGGNGPDEPSWEFAVITASRLIADFIGALVAVSLVQLAIGLCRLALVRWRNRPGLDLG